MDMNVALIVRFVDQLSAPIEKAADKVESFKKRAGRAVSDFSAGVGDVLRPQFTGDQFQANLDRLDRRVDDARNRLRGAVVSALALIAPVLRQADFQDRFIDFANVAQIPIERMGEIERRLVSQTAITGKNKVELLEILAAYVGKGMDLDSAFAAIEATGRAATATKSDVADMTNAGYAVMDNLKVGAGELEKAFDVMAASGKEGSFELKDMARKFPEITAGASALKMKGVPAVAALSAALQVAMKSAGSADQAATNMSNFLGKITAPDTVKNFKKFGINIEKELKHAAESGIDPILHSLQLVQKATGGDVFKMGKLFADKQVLDFLRAMLPNLEEYERIRDKASSAEGIVDQDWINVTSGLTAQMKGLVTEVDNLMSSTGALLPIAQGMIQWLTDAVRAVNAWTSANPELTATIVKVGAGLLALGIASRVLAFGWALTGRQLFKLIGLFYRFDNAGRYIAPLGRMVGRLASLFGGLARGAFRALAAVLRFSLGWGSIARGIGFSGPLAMFASTFAALPGMALAALRRLGPVMRAGMATHSALAFAFEFIDDMGRTPEQRLEHIRKNHERYRQLEKEVEESGFGQAWQRIRTGANNMMGLGADAVPIDVLLAKMQDGWAKVETWTASKTAWLSAAWSDLDLATAAATLFDTFANGAATAWGRVETWVADRRAWLSAAWEGLDLAAIATGALGGFLAGLTAAWASIEAWVSEKAAWLKSKFTFDLSLPDPSGWFGGGRTDDPTPKPFSAQPAAPTSAEAGLSELGSIFTNFSKAGADAGGAMEEGARRAGSTLQAAGQDAGGVLGSTAAQKLQATASSIGTAMGQAAAAEIRKAAASVRISVAAPASTGRDIAKVKAGALHDGVDE